MAKFTYDDKIRIQTLHEQGYGAKRIKKAYPHKPWSLHSINRICHRIKERGTLQNIWNELPQTSINKAVRSFRQRLQLCTAGEGGHFEQLLF